MRLRKLTPEGIVKRQVRDLCRVRGWKYVHIQAGPLSERGIPDAFVYAPGVGWFGCEIKRRGGSLSEHQVAFMQDCHRIGAPYIVCDDPMDLEEWVKKQGRQP